MAKLIAALFGYCVLIACGWWALYWGWGLEPESWVGIVIPPIIGSGIYFMITIAIKIEEQETA